MSDDKKELKQTESPKVAEDKKEDKPSSITPEQAPKIEAKPEDKKEEAPKKDVEATPKKETKEKAAAPNNNVEFFKRKNERIANTKGKPTPGKPGQKGGRPNFRRRIPSEFEERVISIRRVVKVVKGGRRFRFSALVVIGDKKGRVGYGFGKSNEVPDAIKKAIKTAKKSLIQVKIVGEQDTVPHEWIGHHDASKVVVKPAKEGTGLIASESVRAVLELAGVRNVYTKSLGSNTPQNTIKATVDALNNMKTKEEVAKLRDLKSL